MPKKLSFKEKYKRLIDKENVELYPINIMGIPVHFKNYFMPWIAEMVKKFSSDLDGIPSEELLFKILEKYDVQNEIFIFRGTSLLNASDDFVYIGKLIEDFNEATSLKRMRIEMYNCFEKINLINYDLDSTLDPNYISLITDFIYNEQE